MYLVLKKQNAKKNIIPATKQMTNCTDKLLVLRAPLTIRSLPPLPSPQFEGNMGALDVVDAVV